MARHKGKPFQVLVGALEPFFVQLALCHIHKRDHHTIRPRPHGRHLKPGFETSGVVVLDQLLRLAGKRHAGVGIEKARLDIARKQRQQTGSESFFGGSVRQLFKRLIDHRDLKINDLTILIVQGGQSHNPVERRIERGPELMGQFSLCVRLATGRHRFGRV
jgi:hypothetical protein